MRRIVRTIDELPGNAEEKVFVQLRLPPALAEELRAAGEAASRKLPSEIIYRLQGGDDTPADALLYGWIDPDRNKTLGKALAILAGRLEVAGPMTEDRVRDRAAVLGMLKLALGAVLQRLGADEEILSEDEWNFAALEARKFANELNRPERHPHGVGERPDLDILARVAAAEPMQSRKGEGG